MTRIFTLLAAFALLTAGCTDTERSDPVPSQESVPAEATDTVRKALDGDVAIDLKIIERADRRVRIDGITNLPTGTNLMLSVKERTQDGFYGQSKSSVLADGSFQSESFGPADGLKDGVYVADVVMPIPRVQPDHVQRVIGANGEKLSGPLVEAGDFGVTVSANQEFTIGGAQASHVQDERVKARVRQYREWLNKVVALHERLETARSNDWLEDGGNTASLAKWGNFAREFRSDHEQLQSELMDMPVSVRFTVGDPLEYVRQMFHATAFQKLQDYSEASTQYSQSLKELEKFVAEAEGSR